MIEASKIHHREGGVQSLILSNRVYTRRAERDIKKLESNTKESVGKTLLLVITELFLVLKEMELLF